ncbi:MAG: PAS domain-containing protein [Alphaproteobacteria bacterium]|nr:PAS domain-containing protein [Alphaproteobacteria bacterium]
MSSAANIVSLPKGMPENASGLIALDAVDNPILQLALAYWSRLKGERSYPARADLMPRDLAPLLRHVCLLRVLDGGADYEFRIVGDAHVISHGFSMQGLRISDIDGFSPGYGPALKMLYDRAVRRRTCYAFRGWLERGEKNKQYIYSESVFMPMGPDEATIDHVLNVAVYTPRDSYD